MPSHYSGVAVRNGKTSYLNSFCSSAKGNVFRKNINRKITNVLIEHSAVFQSFVYNCEGGILQYIEKKDTFSALLAFL